VRALLRASLAVAVIVLAVVCDAHAGDGQGYALLMDASLSMKGFYDAKPSRWRDVLRDLDRGAERRWRFGDEAEPVRDILRDAGPRFARTSLDKPLRAWLQEPGAPPTAVMVTDNVADMADATGWDAQQRFYAILQGGERLGPSGGEPRSIVGVTILPAVFPFAGTVTGPNDRPRAEYKGSRALAVYVLHRSGSVEGDDVERFIRSILDSAGTENEAIPVLPFGSGWKRSTPDLDMSLVSATGADITLDRASGRLDIANLPMEQGVTLVLQAGITPGPHFALRNAELVASIALPDDEEISSQQLIKAKISPRRADFDPQTRRDFEVTFEIQPIGFFSGVSLMRQAELAFSTSTVIRGEITVSYKTDRQSVLFVGDKAGLWSYDGPPERLGAADPEVQRRLYRVQDLVRGMMPAEGWTTEIVRWPVVIQLRYATGAVVLLVAALMLFCAGAYWALARFSRPQTFDVTTGLDRPQPITLGLFSTVPVLSDDGRCALSLTWFGVCLYASARGGRLTGPRVLAAGGGQVRIAWSDGDHRDVYAFHVRRAGSSEHGSGGRFGNEW
jgi:hypothetical protein